MTQADEDTNSILTDNANRAIQANVAMWPTLESMQVVPSGGQIRKQCKWRHLVAKFGINVSGFTSW